MENKENNQFVFENILTYTPEMIDELPLSPGVYFMKDNYGKILYVGKAKVLKNRVSSYFKKVHTDSKTRALVARICKIDIIMTETEWDALILEILQIQKYSPPYNIIFRDNKFYPFIRLTLKEEFPRITLSRKNYNDGSRYFGPFPSAKQVKKYIEIIQTLFKLRVCKTMPKQVCLYYHMGRCTAPCVGKVSQKEYHKQIKEAIAFLEQGPKDYCDKVEREMRKAATNLNFEKAVVLKKTYETLQYFIHSQHIYLEKNYSLDIIALHGQNQKYVVVFFNIRNGKLFSMKSFTITLKVEETLVEFMSVFLMQYYQESDQKQEAFLVNEKYLTDFKEIFSQLTPLSEKLELKIATSEGEKALLLMAEENAQNHYMQSVGKIDFKEEISELQNILQLPHLPMRIEGFDNAHLQGEASVCAVVSFYGGKPDKSAYRNLYMAEEIGDDDFAMMYDGVKRHYKRFQKEEKPLPDLIIIDGGKGQLKKAKEALEDLGLEIPIIGLAKKEEEIYLPNHKSPLIIPKTSKALQLMQRVRDESHRFSNKNYNKRKTKTLLTSKWDHLEGLGPVRKRRLKQYLMTHEYPYPDIKYDLKKLSFPEIVIQEILEELIQG